MTYTSWRPRNETAEDLEHEAAAGKIIQELTGFEILKLSENQYSIDWCFCKNRRVVGYAEFKNRSRRIDPFLLSLSKWRHGTSLALEAKVPFMVFVRWPDGLFLYKWKNDYTPRLEVLGSARGQNGDKEPCALIPIKFFKRIAD